MNKYHNFAAAQTTDYLLELCYWAHDRREYARKCNTRPDPDDVFYQTAAEDELTRRGVPFPIFFSSVAL